MFPAGCITEGWPYCSSRESVASYLLGSGPKRFWPVSPRRANQTIAQAMTANVMTVAAISTIAAGGKEARASPEFTQSMSGPIIPSACNISVTFLQFFYDFL